MKAFCLIALLMATSTAHAAAPAPAVSTDQLGRMLAGLVREVLPREYEQEKDWGRTKSVTRGVRFEGKLRTLSLHRRKKDVPHGVWRRYRVSQAAPLTVEVRRLRSLEGGRAACTLALAGELDGWARVRHYNRGVHLGTITFEGKSTLRVEIDCEVGVKLTAGERLPALAFDPVVTDARVTIDGFHLNRVGEIKGDVAREIGRTLQGVAEDRINDADLAAKLNRAIDRRREKLRLDPSALVEGVRMPASPRPNPGSS